MAVERRPEPPEPSLARRIFVGADGLRAGWSLLLFLALASTFGWLGVSLVHVLLSAHHPGDTPSPSMLAFTEGLSFAAVLLSTWILSRVERRPMRSYGIGLTPGAARQFLGGLLWGITLLSVLVGILWLTHGLVFTGLLLHGAALVRYAAEWFAAFLFVGLLEEYTLRGFLQFTLARGLAGALRATTGGSPFATAAGFWVTAILLSFVFGFGHGSNPGESPIGLLSAGLAGLVFCLALWRTGSLWWAVGFHATWDWAQSFIYGVADSGTRIQHFLLASHPAGRPLLSGGATGPEGSIFVLPVLGAIAAVILLTLPPRPRSLPTR